jgi:hydrogenase nickel incorporation protein HypB
MFRKSEVLLLNKMDLVELCGCDVGALKENVARVNPDIRILEVSCRTGEGMEGWIGWLRDALKKRGGKWPVKAG